MPRRAREKSESGIYHIILRGANRQELFHDDDDSIRFLETMDKYRKQTEIKVYGWCLMGNHIHLLLCEGKEDISVTMKRIGVSYAWYYNSKYATTGHLFQDRFISENVNSDEYLMTVIRYIHQNPVKAGLVNRPIDWALSSCKEYYGMESYPMGLLDKEFILEMFAKDTSIAVKRFKEFNEVENEDKCLEDEIRKRLTDAEVRAEILKLISIDEMTHMKSLPKCKRDSLLHKILQIKDLKQRQAARIIGISPNLIFKL